MTYLLNQKEKELSTETPQESLGQGSSWEGMPFLNLSLPPKIQVKNLLWGW